MEKKQPSNHKLDSETRSLIRENREEEAGCSSSSLEPKANVNNSDTPNSSKTPEPSTSRNSPDPCCAICLEPLQNKSFTNSCLHMFCFKCLVQWSKVKPECPLCKQRFMSIIHNVQEDFQYDTYYIKNRATETFWNFETPNHGLSVRINATVTQPRFRYRTTLTSSRSEINVPETPSLRLMFENHRRRFAPHSVSVVSTTPSVNHPLSTYRRNIYRNNMWVKPLQANRFRITSPEFFRQNPACTHRLLPWLNRELRVLLLSFESQIVNVLELIMSLITRFDITSQEFYNQLLPYLQTRTRHFIHEFFYFAASPHDMETYDRMVEYEQRMPNAVVSNPILNNEVIVIDNDDDDLSPDSTRPGTSSDISKPRNHKSKGKSRKFTDKMVIKRNPETDSWVTVMSPLPLMHNYSNADYFNCAPSTSGTGINSYDNSFVALNRTTMISPVCAENSSDEGEVEIVETVKPRSERTPEIIDLSSDDEPIIPVVKVSEDDNSSDVVNLSSDKTSSPLHNYSPPTYSPFSPIYSPERPIYSPETPRYSPISPQSPLYSPPLSPPNYSSLYSNFISPQSYSPNYVSSSASYFPTCTNTVSPPSTITCDSSNEDSSSTIECIYDSKTSNPTACSSKNNVSSPVLPRLPSVINPASLEGLHPIDLSTKKSKVLNSTDRQEEKRKPKHSAKSNCSTFSNDSASTSVKAEPHSSPESFQNKQSVSSKVIIPDSNNVLKRELSSWRSSKSSKRKSIYVESSSDSDEETEFSSFLSDSRSHNKKHSKHHLSKKKHKSKKKKNKYNKYLSDSSS